MTNKLTSKIKDTRDYFFEFTKTQQFSGVLLIFCTCLSLLITNSAWQDSWLTIIHYSVKNISLEWFTNDGLMAFFFLLVGLEIKRELLVGELSNRKTAMLPIAGALGGMVVPAIIFTIFNIGKTTENGWAIPTATDIAFAVGIINLLGNRIPTALKIFITALAVVDDLGAVIIIAIFYSSNIQWMYLFALFACLILFNYILKRLHKWFYLVYGLVGLALFLLLQVTHLHTTLAGVLLAIITPYTKNSETSFVNKIEHALNKPVNYFIIPLFAIVNTAIVIDSNLFDTFDKNLAAGILAGLVLGKPIGITLVSYIACKLRLAELPTNIHFKNLFATSLLGGIGFTMSIFISLLAFTNLELIQQSKLVVLIASLMAGVFGYIVLMFSYGRKA